MLSRWHFRVYLSRQPVLSCTHTLTRGEKRPSQVREVGAVWGDALPGLQLTHLLPQPGGTPCRGPRGTRLHREAPRGPCDGVRNWTDGSGVDCWEASDSAGEIGWGGRRLTLSRRAREPASRTSSERLVGGLRLQEHERRARCCAPSHRHGYPRRTAQASGAAKPGEPASLGLSIKPAGMGGRGEAQKGSSRPKIRHGG